MNNAITLITTICAIAAAALMFYLWPIQQQMNQLALEQAEALHVRYGLLSVDEWRDQAKIILASRLADVELELGDEVNTQMYAERLLHLLIDEFELTLEAKAKDNPLLSGIQSFVRGNIVDFDDFRERVPEMSERLVDDFDELIDPEALADLALGQMDVLLNESESRQDEAARAYFSQQYDCPDLRTCGAYLGEQLFELKKEYEWSRLLFIGLFLLPFGVWLFGLFLNIQISKNTSVSWPTRSAVILASTFLIGGLTFPTIAIDARIESLRFELFGSTMEFGQQVLFYESKSILQVVGLLLEEGKLDLVLVGLLIALFSVLFPVAKLVATLLPARMRQQAAIHFLVYRSGKWSMADVFVLAIFMAFIGLRGVVGSQLQQIRGGGTETELIATDYTQLGLGFWLFLLFCLTSLWVSSMSSDKENEDRITSPQPRV
ncbi:MAG: paraquat-inducible protein A [Bacteroidota bacterium]